MAIMEPDDFGAYDLVADKQPAAPPGITQHIYQVKPSFTEAEILDAEEVEGTN